MEQKTSETKNFILGALAVLILIAGAFFIFKRESTTDVSAAGENWMMQRLTGFTYKRQIEITNPTGVDLTDYQIKFTVPYVSEMQSNFNDIRFASIDGVTLLPYWIESINTAASPDIATIWVKVPNIPATGLTYLYMYYGNSFAGSLSNGANTFDFFDDFSGTTIDTNKWTGAATLSGSSPYIATIQTTGNVGTSTLSSISTFGNGYSFRSRTSVSSASLYAGWGFRTPDNYYCDMFYSNYPVAGSFGALSRNPYPTNVTHVQIAPTTGYHVYDIGRNAATSAIYSIDNSVVSTITTNLPTSQLLISFYGHTQAISVDWVLARKFVVDSTGSEPTYVMWGQQLSTVSKAWNNRKAITIDNPGSALTDYQISLNVAYDSDMQPDFDDLRFTSSDGSTLLSYWLEKKQDGNSAKVWVKVPTIPAASATVIYMYYGNGWTGTGSNGTNTFIFFDDFNNGLSKWIQSSGTSVAPGWVLSNGELRGSNTKDRLKSISTFSVATSPIVLETKHRHITMPLMGFMSGGFYASSSVGLGVAPFAMPNYYFNNGWNWLTGGLGSPSSTDLLTKISAKSATAVDLSISNYNTGASYGSVSNINRSITSMPIALGERYDDANFYNYDAYWDWIIVHKYSAVIPTVTFSTEEVPTGTCGSSDGQYFASAPTVNLCAFGVPSDPSTNGNGIWTWTCRGVGETLPTSCSTSIFIGKYRKAITLTNSSGGPLNNYPTSINVAYDSDMQPDFDDLRFTSSDGSTLLSYWLESKGSNSAKVWVKVPTIPVSPATTIYMYYGNSAEASGSNGASTFDFFDDFSGTSLDTTKWDIVAGSPAMGGSSVAMRGSASETITTKNGYGTNYVIRAKASTPILRYSMIGFYQASLDSHRAWFYTNLNNDNHYGVQTQAGGSAYGRSLGNIDPGSRIWEVARNGSTSVIFKIDDSVVATSNTNISTQAIKGTLNTNNTGSNPIINCDWFLIRKYASSEPAVVFGTEALVANECGSANGTYVSSAPSGSTLCSNGSTPTVTGTGPWYWTCTTSGGASFSCMAYSSSGQPSLTGWGYKRLVTVSSTSTLTNYAMKIDVPYITGKMNSDFSDLRFAKSDGTIYPYWIEKINTNGSARIWVKVPTIAITPATTFYMYYGNSSAPPASDGDNTFIFFDDFSGTIIDTAKWSETDVNGFISQNETLNINGGDENWGTTAMYTKATFNKSDGLAIQSKYKTSEVRGSSYYEDMVFGAKDASSTAGVSAYIYGLYPFAVKTESVFNIIENGGQADWNVASLIVNQQYDVRQIIKTGNGDTIQLSQNSGDTWNTIYDSSTVGQSTFKFGFTHYQGGDTKLDNIIVRKYVSNEPTAVIGPEIILSGGPSVSDMVTAGEWDSFAYCDYYFDINGNLVAGDNGKLQMLFKYNDTTPGGILSQYMIAIGSTPIVGLAEINTGWINSTVAPGTTIPYGGVSVGQTWIKTYPYQITYGDGTTYPTYYWWVNVKNNNGAESGWTQTTFRTPQKHFPIVRVVPVTVPVGDDVNLCSGADISNPADPCYSICWRGTGAAVVNSSSWKCSVCYDGSGSPASCSTNGNAINWILPGTLGVDYTFASGSSTSANPVIRFISTTPKTVGLNIHGSECGNQGTFIVNPSSLLPKWKEVSPFQ